MIYLPELQYLLEKVDEQFSYHKRRLSVVFKSSLATGNMQTGHPWNAALLMMVDGVLVVRIDRNFMSEPGLLQEEKMLTEALVEMITSGLWYNDKAQTEMPGLRQHPRTHFNYRQHDISNPAKVLWPLSQ